MTAINHKAVYQKEQLMAPVWPQEISKTHLKTTLAEGPKFN